MSFWSQRLFLTVAHKRLEAVAPKQAWNAFEFKVSFSAGAHCVIRVGAAAVPQRWLFSREAGRNDAHLLCIAGALARQTPALLFCCCCCTFDGGQIRGQLLSWPRGAAAASQAPSADLQTCRPARSRTHPSTPIYLHSRTCTTDIYPAACLVACVC